MKTPITIKADQSFFDQIDRARTATFVHQTRSEFIRNAVTTYLIYFNQKVLPILSEHTIELDSVDTPSCFFAASGAQEYEKWFR
jgi:hypothetical protein